jgi:sugar lactone lactonase YvrE
VRGLVALAALLVAVGSVPVAAQSVQFFGTFQSYNQSMVQNAQGLVANAQGDVYVSGSHALGYVPVDVNGVPIVSGEASVPGYPSQGEVMGMAIDASNNIFRADKDSPNGPAVEMFTYGGSPLSYAFSYIGSGWSLPTSVTVDSNSNVYVPDGGTGEIVKLHPNGLGGYTQSTLFTNSALVNTTGLSIDSAGDFYVASGSNYGVYPLAPPTQTAVYKITNNGDSTYSLSTIGSGWTSPSATSVDAAGNVWVVDYGAGTINLLVPTGGGSFNQTVYQNIPSIRTLMINQAGRMYGFAYSTVGGEAVIWTGGTPPHNLGTYSVGASAPTVTVTVDFMSGATAGAFNVTTQGASTGDFQATGGTCAPNAYTALQSCTVDVTFTPKAPGLRTGALVVTDNNGNVLGTNYFYGTGVAPSIAYLPGTFSTVIPNTSGLGTPFGAALDQAGNLYVTDVTKNTLSKFAAGSTTATVIDSSLQDPVGMTVDGAGNLWVADWTNNDIVLETLTGPAAYAKSVPFSGLAGPYDVAVDGSRNVYIAEFLAGDVLKETLNNGSYAQSTVVSGLGSPYGVAVDSSGNVYVTDTLNNRVLEETPSGSSYAQTIVANSGLSTPDGLAIDPNGNVYISDSNNHRIVKATPSGPTFVQSTLLNTGMNLPAGLALDAAGDLYIADMGGRAIDELNVSTAPSFSFANTVAGSESSDSPKTATLFNYGNATLNISTISIPAGFTSDATTCSLSSEVLAANTYCLLGINFMPTSAVPYSGTVTIADDNLNAPATQTIGLSGTGLPDVILSPASESLPVGTVGVAYSQTFSASGGSSPYNYAVTITSGTMPTGLSFSGGVLSGTPSASGSVTFSIVATDSSSTPGPYASSSQSYSLTINAAPIVLSLSPGSLPGGAVGIPYSQTITASGGSGSYNYAVTAGSLPAGLSLNASTGALSGTPTVAGPIGFTITATDTIANVTASQGYAPTIYAVASAAPAQNAGSSNIGSPASTTTLTFTFNVPATVASINVVTQGVANQDFTNAGSGTCTAVAYSATNTCTVDVTFTPQAAGTRYGAVLLEDASGNVLGTGYASGTGTGPQITFQPGTESTVAGAAAPYNLATPVGVAVDAGGNLYIPDYTNGAVYKETLSGGSYTQSTIATLPYVTGVALDGAGNVYIAKAPTARCTRRRPRAATTTRRV